MLLEDSYLSLVAQSRVFYSFTREYKRIDDQLEQQIESMHEKRLVLKSLTCSKQRRRIRIKITYKRHCPYECVVVSLHIICLWIPFFSGVQRFWAHPMLFLEYCLHTNHLSYIWARPKCDLYVILCSELMKWQTFSLWIFLNFSARWLSQHIRWIRTVFCCCCSFLLELLHEI